VIEPSVGRRADIPTKNIFGFLEFDASMELKRQ
jgi:hypothetical protein